MLVHVHAVGCVWHALHATSQLHQGASVLLMDDPSSTANTADVGSCAHTHPCQRAVLMLHMQEALELGASVLLMDEDTCATNFMMRDARMAALVAADREPITPFSTKIA